MKFSNENLDKKKEMIHFLHEYKIFHHISYNVPHEHERKNLHYIEKNCRLFYYNIKRRYIKSSVW